MDSLVRDTAQRIFRDLQDDPQALWSAMQDNGFSRAWSPEHLGGTGLSMADGFELIQMSAAVNCGVPFAETLLASFFLSTAGLETPDGQFSLATNLVANDAARNLEVPFAATADYVIHMANNQIEYFEIEETDSICRLRPHGNIELVKGKRCRFCTSTKLAEPRRMATDGSFDAHSSNLWRYGPYSRLMFRAHGHTRTVWPTIV
jgi:hypothetical protein